eukprot:GFKZ01005774.1.p1 GENE.GFKZ01005774.1~~GFKZ01005774.1.p1  ORF type:complete len:1203 (+),score=230.67 GFKZ01005774.1:119-3727(+)
MEGEAELRQNWEFAATSKLLKLLSIPLSFSVPDPDELEHALLNPAQHIPLLANLHGRLLGLSTGTSSAKKWLTATSRFIAKRPFDFDHILARDQHHPGVKGESAAAVVKDEPREEPEAHIPDVNPAHEENNEDPPPSARFPREENEYVRLGPVTRLLILHTIAELVISEHDTLLSAGSISDIPLDDMRHHSFASDAVGNKYWYFGDGRRIYREPGRKEFKTRLQQAEEDAAAAEKAAQELAVQREKFKEDQRKKEAARLKEEARRKREEKKRKSMEKWAPRVAARRTTRASRRAEQSLLAGAHNATSPETSTPVTQPVPDMNCRGTNSSRGSRSRQALSLNGEIQSESRRGDIETSHNLMNRTQNEDRPVPAASAEASLPPRTRKRPRKGKNFDDPTLRDCEGWETLCNDTESLKEILQRFHPDMVTVLSSEKALVSSMEEDILPEFEEREAKIRKEQERLVKKRRNEMLIITSKRSSRVQALEQKREEAARRAAEEEEKERELQNRKADFKELLKNQVMDLARDLAVEIRNARRAHGITDAINRDEQLHRGVARKAARALRTDSATARRSARVVGNTHRGPLTEDDRSASLSANVRKSSRLRGFSEEASCSPQQRSDDNTPEAVGDPDHSEEHGRRPLGVDDKTDDISTSLKAPNALPSAVIGEKTEQDIQNDGEGMNNRNHPSSEKSGDGRDKKEPFTSGLQEETIGESYTWMTNPDDGEPIRVLDKFFFALKPNFEDAPLELVDNRDLHVTGLGILVPPFGSDAKAIRVEIGKIDEWIIEYGTDQKLWAKTEKAWYELREPALEYQTAFVSTRRKYELCVRIAILGATYRTADLTYSSLVELLGLRYNDMQAFSESQIVEEKRFIISQMESVGTKALLQSGFIRELRKRIRQEDERLRRTESSRKGPKTSKNEQSGNSGKAEGSSSKSGSRARRRPVVPGKQAVPRVVSTLVNSILRTATRSHTGSRKRKQKPDTNQACSDDPEQVLKRMRQASLDDDAVDVPRVTASEPVMGRVTDENKGHLIHVPKEIESSHRRPQSRPTKAEVSGLNGSCPRDDAEQASIPQVKMQTPLSGPTNGKALPKETAVPLLEAKGDSSSLYDKSSSVGFMPAKEEKKLAAGKIAMAGVTTAAENHVGNMPSEETPFKHGRNENMGQRTMSSCAMTDMSNGHFSNGQESTAAGAYDVQGGSAALEGGNRGH